MKAKQLGWILVGAAVGILVACSGSSSADTGLTQSQVQTMITAAVSPLESEITALQTQVQTLQASSTATSQAQIFIKAPNAGAALAASIRQMRGRVTYAASAGTSTGASSTCKWTLTGRPDNSDPIVDNTYAGISCTGYYFLISGSAAGGTSYIQQPNTTLGFSGPDCTGTPYIQTSSMGAVTNGFVVTIGPYSATQQIGSAIYATDYYYVPSGAQTVTVALQSHTMDSQGTWICYNLGAGAPQSGWYQMLVNDPSVTGIPSAPIPGPVLISN